MGTSPPPLVLEAFGASGRLEPLAGGAGLSVLADGQVVLKPIDDPVETTWVQHLTHRIDADGFRVAEPVAAEHGAWVVEGWCASRFIPGLRALAPEWDHIIDVGHRFSSAATAACDGSERVLADRHHRWAVADRVAWGEADVTLDTEAEDVLSALQGLLGTLDANAALIHGDLTSNVFVDPDGVPVVLDISPYLRPANWASAIVVADAVLWNGVDAAVATGFAASADHRDLLGRALIFRMVAEQLADDPRHGASLGPYRSLIERLG